MFVFVAMRSAASCMVLGATLVQFVPYSVQTVRAAWCWPNDPPKCTIPTTANGACLKAPVNYIAYI